MRRTCLRSLSLGVLLTACGVRLTPADDLGGPGTDGGGADQSIPCVGLACQIPAHCDGGTQATQIAGHLLAPNGLDPVPGAAVYVPLTTVGALPTGASCELCDQVTGAAASTTTAFDGSFILTGVPAGDNIPLVLQHGAFRRVITMSTTACTQNQVPADAGLAGVRLPHYTGELSPQNSIPRIAVASGDYDQIECVLSRMGITQIDVYNDRDPDNADLPPSIAPLSTLLTDQATLLGYQIVVVNCTDNQYQTVLAQPQVQANLAAFVAAGGRLFVTDWAYDIIDQVAPFAPYLCFEPQTMPGAPMCGVSQTPEIADSNLPYSGLSQVLDPEMARWLALFPNTINGDQQVEVDYSFVVVSEAGTDPQHKATVWVSGPVPQQIPQTVTFDYPQCGRVHFSTYNTEPNGVVDDSMRWPDNCSPDFAPQERLLEYLLFQVSACVNIVG